MNLYRLIYSSYGKANLSYYDLTEIMQKSEKNNQHDGVTGMLCYGDSVFLQILEGDRAIISKTYQRISRDTRHHSPELIEFIPIESRLFSAWSMKAINLSQLKSEKVKNLILKYSTSATFKPQTMTAQQCINLMQALGEFFDQ